VTPPTVRVAWFEKIAIEFLLFRFYRSGAPVSSIYDQATKNDTHS